MIYKKTLMWGFVFATILILYVMFNHSQMPLMFSYFIYPFVCTTGLLIAGIIGREYIMGKIILTGIIGTFSTFILTIIFMMITLGPGVIFWGVWLFFAGFNYLLILGIVISGSFHSVQWLKDSELGWLVTVIGTIIDVTVTRNKDKF